MRGFTWRSFPPKTSRAFVQSQTSSHSSNSAVTGFSVFGGLALNLPVGGLNIHAVRTAIELGAREIWMPTIHAASFIDKASHVPALSRTLKERLEGIRITDKEGRLLPELVPILEAIAEADIILGTGHISKEEAFVLVKAAKEVGVKKILITHPMAAFLGYSVDDMKRMTDAGAYLDHCYIFATKAVAQQIPVSQMAQIIKETDIGMTVLSSDGGQTINPPPVEMFSHFVNDLLKEGLDISDIDRMTIENPAKLLGLD